MLISISTYDTYRLYLYLLDYLYSTVSVLGETDRFLIHVVHNKTVCSLRTYLTHRASS